MSSSSPALAELAPGISAAGRLDRADIDALAQAGIRTIINNRPDGEDPGARAALPRALRGVRRTQVLVRAERAVIGHHTR